MKYFAVFVVLLGVACAQECGQAEWKCENERCIAESWKCNGWDDCGDNSDERECPSCNGFSCASGRCIPSEWVCDGIYDCGDISDERECPPCDGFSCPSGFCIPSHWVCDGINDCRDFADERECPEGAKLRKFARVARSPKKLSSSAKLKKWN